MIIDMILMEPEANNVPYAFAIFVKLQHMRTSVMFAFTSVGVAHCFLESLGLNGV